MPRRKGSKGGAPCGYLKKKKREKKGLGVPDLELEGGEDQARPDKEGGGERKEGLNVLTRQKGEKKKKKKRDLGG